MTRSLALLALMFGATSTAIAVQQAPPPAQQTPPVPPAPPAPQVPSPKAIAAAEAAVDALAAREFAKVFAQLAAPMQMAMSPEKLSGTWDSIQAQAGGFVKRTGSRAEVRGAYTVVIVACDFERNKVEVVATIDGAGEIAGLQARPAQPAVAYAPPAYANSAAFTEREVTVGSGEWALPGTLTMPTGAGPFPAVVLVHGSGPNDRDETFGPNKTFKDLALGLGSRGVAVLRYDKRTKVYGAQVAKLNPFTLKGEAIDDALAAVSLLRKEAGIDATRIFVLGHSLGGTAAPRIGAADPGIAGLIMLAGAVRSLDQSIVDQMQYLADADGVISEAEKRALENSLKLKEAVSKLTAADIASTASIGGAPASVLARPAGLRSRGSGGHAQATSAGAAGWTGLSGHRGGFRTLESGARQAPGRGVQAVPRAQPSVPARPGQEPAARILGAGTRAY